MRDEFRRRCNEIEEAYEFMLAYAAQGLSGDRRSQAGGQLRQLLSRAASALDGLGRVFAGVVDTDALEPLNRYRDFGAVLERDASAAATAVNLVLAQPAISSQLVDNLNASIHLRALLTDLFLLDEILRGTDAQSTQAVSNEPIV